MFCHLGLFPIYIFLNSSRILCLPLQQIFEHGWFKKIVNLVQNAEEGEKKRNVQETFL